MVEDSVVRSVRCFLSAVSETGTPITFGVVFGSQATGRAHQWSDIDLLVVSPRYDKHRNRDELDNLWSRAAHVDSRLEPIPCGEIEWREDDSRAIVEIARREGEIIYP